MRFKVTCVVDEKLLGVVTELLAPHSRVVVQLADEAPPAALTSVLSKQPAAPTRRRPGVQQGLAPLGTRGAGPLLALRGVARGDDYATMKEAFAKSGLAGNGVSACLSKLARHGLVRHAGTGQWAITPRGDEAVKRVDGLKVKRLGRAEQADLLTLAGGNN
jgi:hypothetical protein